MKSEIFQLGNLKRLTGFDYTLQEVGMMVNHCADHNCNTLTRYFICFGFNREKYGAVPEKNAGRISMGVLAPGTVLNTVKKVYHDELFFSYPESLNGKLDAFFARIPPEKLRHISVHSAERFKEDLEKIRSLLQSRMIPGAADQLDLLAVQMVTGALADPFSFAPEEEEAREENRKIKLIAEKLKQGEKLSALIRKYSFSRRAFYYAWKKQFTVSPKEMENTARLEKAQDLLLHGSLTLAEIAAVCHFSSHRYFHECFLKHFSCTPGEYRKRFR